MKKLFLALLIFPFFIYGCDPDENNNDKTDTVKVEEIVTPPTDTTEITLTEEEVDVKSDNLLQKSEDINKKLDQILNSNN